MQVCILAAQLGDIMVVLKSQSHQSASSHVFGCSGALRSPQLAAIKSGWK